MANEFPLISNEYLQQEYATRRQERLLGMSVHQSLICLQNFLMYADVYSWPGESVEAVAQMKDSVKSCYDLMKAVEKALLNVSDSFYAPILPREEIHRIKEE